jgi:K+-sensing histidine kinase KdpD
MAEPTPPVTLPPLRILLERAVHDLKNPLAVVRATLEWLDAELGTRSGDVGEAVRDATDATARLATIVDHLHAVARLTEPGAMSPETVDASELVEAAVRAASTRPSVRSRGIALELAPGTRIRALDRPLVVEALAASFEAAARHAPADAALAVRIVDGDPAGQIAIVIATEEEAGEAQPGGTLPGSGLGLLFARACCEAHGGSLDVAGASSSRSVRIAARFARV